MQPRSRPWWLLVIVLAAVIATAGWFGRQQLATWTRARTAQQYQQQIADLPERQAARLIEQLAAGDREWLDLVVAAWSDSRPPVAAAAVSAVQSLVERWSQLPAAEASPRVEQLARLLAQHAPRMDAVQRDSAAVIAQRLLVWPVDGRQMNAARFIADCEALVRLPPSEPEELRLAAAPPLPPIPEVTLPAAEPLPAVTPPAITMPPANVNSAPAPLADANRERPQEPRRPPSPKAIRISDE